MGHLANLTSLTVLLTLALTGCGPSTDLARSCGGERVLECDPYEWSVVLEGTFTQNVPIGDPTIRVDVTVDLESCGATTPAPIAVHIQALVGSGDDLRVADVATVRADSTSDTRIETTIGNPFTLGGSIPAERDITLRFIPVIGGCEGSAFELPYRTGPVVRP